MARLGLRRDLVCGKSGLGGRGLTGVSQTEWAGRDGMVRDAEVSPFLDKTSGEESEDCCHHPR